MESVQTDHYCNVTVVVSSPFVLWFNSCLLRKPNFLFQVIGYVSRDARRIKIKIQDTLVNQKRIELLGKSLPLVSCHQCPLGTNGNQSICFSSLLSINAPRATFNQRCTAEFHWDWSFWMADRDSVSSRILLVDISTVSKQNHAIDS